MTSEFMEKVNVIVVRDDPDTLLWRIKAIDPERLNVRKVWHSFTPELYNQWPSQLVDRFMRSQPMPSEPEGQELDAVLASAHVLLAGFPYPKDLVARMPGLRWAHFAFAGISNLSGSEFWGSNISCTSSRGHSGAQPIAESALAAAFMFARKLHVAVQQTSKAEFSVDQYSDAMLLRGKTMGIVGLGGIGSSLARIARGVGMRVVATRRSAAQRVEGVDETDVLYPPRQLHDMLSEADFVVITAMWTPETANLMDIAAFSAMKQGAFIINVARGEIVDELAMVAALESGKLGGAYLDVYTDEFNRAPEPRLVGNPNVIMSPHVSQKSDGSPWESVDIFCENLRRFLDGGSLKNVIDWKRGY